MMMCKYFLCFIIYSFIGWLYECVFYSVQQKRFVNSGFLNGCLCPIYGIGAWLILIFLGDMGDMRKVFLLGMIVTSILEYFTSWFLEKMFHEKWWDYTHWAFNLNGRICLLGALAFGTMAVMLVKFINPLVMNKINLMSHMTIYIFTFASILGILIDTAFTIKNIDMVSKKLWFVEKQSELSEKYKYVFKNNLAAIIGDEHAEQFTRFISGVQNDENSILERIKKIIK